MPPATRSILDHGAVADGVTDDSRAIQHAIDAAHAAGGGRVVIPAGRTVMAGSFDLRSRVELHVEEGATLLSATTIEAFPGRVFAFGDESEKRRWIGARHAEDITLSGRGVIDGRALAFALGFEGDIFRPTLPWRPAMTCFEGIRRITVRDLTFRNAANWTLHFTGCEDVLVEDIRIDNDIRFPNADGIDPDHCRRVRIRRCHIVAGDDCIVLKNTAPFAAHGPCEDIEVSDCHLESASAAIKIGSESHDAFRRILFRDCVIERSHRALAIQLRDPGDVEDVEFRNIRITTRRYSPMWWGAGEAITVTAVPRDRAKGVGRIRRVTFRDIHAVGENGLVAYADSPGGIDGLLLERVHLEVRRVTDWPSGLFDVRPFGAGYHPRDSELLDQDTPWGRPARVRPSVVRLDGARGVVFRDVTTVKPLQADLPWEEEIVDVQPTRLGR